MHFNLNHRYLKKMMYKIGHGKAKIYLYIIGQLGNDAKWKSFDKQRAAEKTGYPIKQINKAIRKMKKGNVIRYRSGKIKYAPQLLSKKGILINKIKSSKKHKKYKRHQHIKNKIKGVFHHSRRKKN